MTVSPTPATASAPGEVAVGHARPGASTAVVRAL
jgi:hypothetical protein